MTKRKPAAPVPTLEWIEPALRPLAVPVADLKADPRNARTHDERNLAAITESLRRFGQQKPVVVDSGGVVIAGNATLAAARTLGWTHLAVVRTRLAGTDRTAFAVADNRTAELAAWDDETLADLLGELQDQDLSALAATGFTPEELQSLLDGLNAGGTAGQTDPDATPEPPAKAVSRKGTIYRLGNHRLMCGDSTKPEDVGRLMGGEKAGLMNTDPPYGIAYTDEARVAADRAHVRPQRKEKWAGGIKNDGGENLDGAKLQEFLEAVIRVAVPHLDKHAAFYLWHPMLTQGTFFAAAAAAAAADILIHRQIIWVKPSLLFGFGDYHWRHELCFYGWRRGFRPKFLGERNQTTVWEITHETSNGNREHPTQKPVELFIRPMKNHLTGDGIAYEPFAGSGSQIIAAESLGRRCFGMEIEPRYVDVARRRWAEFVHGEGCDWQALTQKA